MAPRHPSRLTSLLLAGAGGVVADLAFPGVDLWALAFVGMALLFFALGRDSARWNALVGLVWGIAFFAPHIHWTSIVVGAPAYALVVLQALFVAVFGVAWSWARRGAVIWRSAALQVPAFAVVWVGVEELRSAMPFGGFPWGRLAFSQGDSALLRLAWLGGVPLVSGVVAALGALLAVALVNARHVRVFRTLGALGLVAAVLASGLLVPLGSRAETGTMRIGAVQGNVDMTEDDLRQRQRRVVVDHAAGTSRLADEVGHGSLDLVIWPENVTATNLADDAESAAYVEAAAQEAGAPVLLGTMEYPPDGGRYNLSVLWEPGVGVVDDYRKQRPAPFSEYIPLRDLLRPLSSQVDRVTNDMIAGTESAIISVDVEHLDRTVDIATVICFEVAYDWVIREAVQTGGEFLVVQTNNVTFGMSDQSEQQLAMARVRAVETGRATLSLSTVGVSAVITPSGAVTNLTELFTADEFAATVPLRTTITPAVFAGQYIVWGLAGLAVFVVGAGAVGAARVRRPDRGAMLGR